MQLQVFGVILKKKLKKVSKRLSDSSYVLAYIQIILLK